MSPQVSIIVPNFNYAYYLPERMSSILSQTFRDYEIILLDDASSDNSREVLEQFKQDTRVSDIIINETNSGNPFAQWKKGIELAKGEYIWIAEADDSAAPEFLEKAVAGLEKSGAVLFFSSSYCMDSKGNKIDKEYDSWAKPAYCQDASSYILSGKFFLKRYLHWGNCIYNASGAVFCCQMG